jgi:hypothetical protein
VRPKTADHLLATSRLRPSTDALARANFLSYSIDPHALRSLVHQIVTGLIDGGGPAASALAEGSPFAQSVRYALSSVVIGSRFNEFLAGDSYSVTLGSISGLVSDTGTHLSVEASMVGARPLTWATVSRSRSPTSLRGFGDLIVSGDGRADLVARRLGVAASLGFSASVLYRRDRNSGQVSRWRDKNEMADVESYSRTGLMLFVSADILFSARIGTRAESALTVRSELTSPAAARQVRADVRADDAAVVMISWSEARNLGIAHPEGEATESGWYLPPSRPNSVPGPSRAAERRNEGGPDGPVSGTSTGEVDSGSRQGKQVLAGAAEAVLASASQLLPAFRDWTLVSGQATDDGRLVLYGEPLEPGRLTRILARHLLGGGRSGLVLVVTAGLEPARRLAEESALPVVATAGRVVFEPDGAIRAEGVMASVPGEVARGGWVLVRPGHHPGVPLPGDLAGALTRRAALEAVARVRQEAGPRLSGTMAGADVQGPPTRVVWPGRAGPEPRARPRSRTLAELFAEDRPAAPDGVLRRRVGQQGPRKRPATGWLDCLKGA